MNGEIDGRHVLQEPDGTWWEVGWDRGIGTYWAQHLTTDSYGVEQLLAWHGTEPGDVTTLNTLTAAMGRPLPRAATMDLHDQARHSPTLAPPARPTLAEWTVERPSRNVPHVDFGTRWRDADHPGVERRLSWIPDTGELYAVDHRSERSVDVLAVLPSTAAVNRALDGWASQAAGVAPDLGWVRDRIDRLTIEVTDVSRAGLLSLAPSGLDASATPPHAEPDGTRRWDLPAAPVAAALTAFSGSPGVDHDPTAFAAGLGLEENLVRSVLQGTTHGLDIDQIAAVCEALHCSPYDLWGAQEAGTILHAYGPERWPRHIQPLDDLRDDLVDDDFIKRRLRAQAASQLTVVSPPASVVHATCYRRTGVLAVDPLNGGAREVDPNTPPSPTLEYHFTFRQLAGTLAVPTRGSDLDPEVLAEAAAQLQGEPWLAATAMVRFVDAATGNERWLGRAEPVGAWEEWDDPRRYYPGDPSDVLDASIHGLVDNPPRTLQLTSDVMPFDG